MSRHTMVVNGVSRVISPDDGQAEAEALWAVVSGRVVDEITGQPPRTALRVASRQPGLPVRLNGDGFFALVARPWRRFPPLAAAGYTIAIEVSADGYLPLTRTATLPSGQLPLTANAGAATRILSLASTAGLSAGQLLLVGPAGATSERCTIASLGPGPGQVTLATDLVHPHSAGDPVVPDAFVPFELDDLPLRRCPVTIRGRTVARTSSGTVPVPNASVHVTGVWRTTADVRHHLPALPARMAGLQPGVYAERGAATGFTPIAPAAAAGEDKRLTGPAAAGAAALPLTDSLNLVAGGSVLAIDPDDPARQEQLRVAALAPAVAPFDPVTATLGFPLRNGHAPGARAVRVVPGGPVGPVRQLAEPALPGDRTVFLNNAALPSATGTARLDTGPSEEFQQYALFQVTSDAEGYYALPPIHRAAQIEIEASAPGHPAISAAGGNAIIFQPSYIADDAWLDVVFDS